MADYNPEDMSWEQLELAHQDDRMALLKAVVEQKVPAQEAQFRWPLFGKPVEADESALTFLFEDDG